MTKKLTIKDVYKFRYLVKGLIVQTTDGMEFYPGDDIFKKDGTLRKGWTMTNTL